MTELNIYKLKSPTNKLIGFYDIDFEVYTDSKAIRSDIARRSPVLQSIQYASAFCSLFFFFLFDIDVEAVCR